MLSAILKRAQCVAFLAAVTTSVAAGANDYLPQEVAPLPSSPEQMSETQRKGVEAAREMARTFQGFDGDMLENMPEKSWMQQMARGAAGIADKAMAADRKKVLDLLGLSDSSSRVYVFVSFAMPIELLRAYAREAMWAGGILVVRGAPEGMGLKEFISQKLYQLVGRKGASATLQIDPRLFDVFNVTAAPTIVYTERPEPQLCPTTYEASVRVGGNEVPYFRCDPLDEEDYWKVAGNVTIQWALEQFAQDGAAGAAEHLAALRRSGLAGGQEQAAFEGDWDEVEGPAALARINEMLSPGQAAYETPYGIGIGPAGQDNPAEGVLAVPRQ